MSDIFLAHRLGGSVSLCISELSERTVKDQWCDNGRAPRGGIYLYILDDRPVVGGVTVLARMNTEQSAVELFDLLRRRGGALSLSLGLSDQSADTSTASL